MRFPITRIVSLDLHAASFPILSDFVSQRPKIAGTRFFAALRMTLGGVLNPSIVTLSNAKSLRTSSVKDLFSSFILVFQLFVNPFCNPKSAICRRRTGINQNLQEHFPDLFLCDAGVAGRADMHSELVVFSQRRKEGQGQHVPGFLIDPSSCPNGSPCALRNNALKISVEIGFVGLCPRDVLGS